VMTYSGADPRQVEIPNASCPVCQQNAPPPGRQICLTCQVPYPAARPAVESEPFPAVMPFSPVDALFSWAATVPILTVVLGWGIRLDRPRRQHSDPQIPLKPPISSTRPQSMGTKRLSKRARKQLKNELRGLRKVYQARPKVFGDCPPVGTPCGFVSCRHNLF